MGQLKAGAYAVDITPPLGTPMSGYGDRTGVSTGVHDPLMASAIALDDGRSGCVIIALDLIAVDAPMTAEVRERVRAATGLGPDQVLLSASHTHSGPAVRDRYGSDYFDQALYELTIRKAASAAIAAWERREPARWGAGTGRAPGIGSNRRDPKGSSDDSVTVLRLEGAGGLIGLAYNFACHPTLLDYHNMLISADYPGAARRTLHSVYGPDLPVLFLNGAAADISTRHLRREPTFREAERLGRILGGEVLRVAESIATTTEAEVRGGRVTMSMPLRQLPTEAEAQGLVEKAAAAVQACVGRGLPADRGEHRTAIVNLQGARATLGLVRQGMPDRLEGEFQMLRIGDTAWFSVPGELFTETGTAVRSVNPNCRTQVVTYANGAIGYILNRVTHAAGGYEAGNTRLAPEAEDAVVEAARTLHAMLDRQEG